LKDYKNKVHNTQQLQLTASNVPSAFSEDARKTTAQVETVQKLTEWNLRKPALTFENHLVIGDFGAQLGYMRMVLKKSWVPKALTDNGKRMLNVYASAGTGSSGHGSLGQ